MKRLLSTLTLLLAMLLHGSAQGYFAFMDTEEVPADRLIENLSKRLASKLTESAQIRSGEQVKIWTWKHKHLDGVHVVDEEGFIELPRIGPWKVSGKTLSQVKKELNGRVNPKARDNYRVFVEQSWQQRKGRLLPGEIAELHYELARLHAMKYSRDIREFDALVGGERPFFGYEPDDRFTPDLQRHPSVGGIPWQRRRQYGKPSEKEAQKHLAAAVDHYRKAVKLKPDHLPAQLGLGWCLDQSGDKKAAVESYREALALAWKSERNAECLLLNGSFVVETAHYLLPLLDPQKDAEEIEKVKGYSEAALMNERAITPLLVPLEDDAALAGLVNRDAGVRFDLDGSGLRHRWGWITPKAAWLVWDPHGSGKVTSGLQMFGSVTYWIFWENGYQALSALDDDGDGALSGHELEGLALWHDRNSNGVSDDGEVQTVKSWGIQSLSCHSCRHPAGIAFSPGGVVFRGGTTRPTYDWIAPGR